MITISDVIKTIKNNYEYKPVHFSLIFGDIANEHDTWQEALESTWDENQDIGMLLSFAQLHKLSTPLTHALFCEKYTDRPSLFTESFYKTEFTNAMNKEKLSVNQLKPLRIHYTARQCTMEDNTGVKPLILPTGLIRSSNCGKKDVIRYNDCQDCELAEFANDVPINRIIYRKLFQDTTTETVGMLSNVAVQYLDKVHALGYSY